MATSALHEAPVHASDTNVSPTIAPEASSASSPYPWTRHWWPVAPVSYLDPSRPTPVTLLGKQLAVWRHAQDGWVALEDRCPHRLAPLSEGRLEGGGTRLMCSYHGWQFDGKGACTSIPQLVSDSKAAATATGSQRSCATRYPTCEKGGLLFAWMDASPEGRAKAAASEPFIPQGMADAPPGAPTFEWGMNEVPNDFGLAMEQPMDPSHANFLHHGVLNFKKENSIPFEGEPVPPSNVDLQSGFVWRHRGYEKKNQGMHAVREFHPPFTVRAQYDMPAGPGNEFCIMIVPVRPGWCRIFGKLRITPPAASQPPAGQAATTSSNDSGITAAVASSTSTNGSGSKAAANGASSNGNGNSAHVPANVNGNGAASAFTDSANGNGTAALPGADAAAHAPQQHRQANQDAQEPVPQQQQKPVPSQGFSLKALLYGLYFKLPHYLQLSHELMDQDVVILTKQYHTMQRYGLSASNYNLMTTADLGIVAMSRWLKLAGYPGSLWGSSSPNAAGQGARAEGASAASAPPDDLPLERLLSRYERHVKSCATCQKGLRLWTRVAAVLTAAAALAAAAAVAAVHGAVAAAAAGTAAAGLPWGAAAAVGAAAVLAWVSWKAWETRTELFISGVPSWTRKGGYSLVPRA